MQEIDDLLDRAVTPDDEEAVEGELERTMRRNLLQVNQHCQMYLLNQVL
jgi:hypothetical protein